MFYGAFEILSVVRKCMKKVTESDSDVKNYDEYENFDNDYESSRHRDLNVEDTSRSAGNYDRARPNTFGNGFNPRINQHYEPQTGGNYYDPRFNDRRDSNSNPYHHTYNDNNNFNNRNNNFYGSRNNNDSRHNSNSTNDKHEKDRACVLQCFFQELKMVRSFYWTRFISNLYERR